MNTGTKGIELIKSFESLHDGNLSVIGLQPKMCPALIWTEGYGRAMRYNGGFLKGAKNKALAEKLATIKTEEQAEKALIEDLKIYERIVISKIKFAVSQNKFDALVSHTYNTGGSQTLFNLVNQKQSDAVIRVWFETKYIRGGGKVQKGLIRRRKAEADLFFTK
jgi:lysozyme